MLYQRHRFHETNLQNHRAQEMKSLWNHAGGVGGSIPQMCAFTRLLQVFSAAKRGTLLRVCLSKAKQKLLHQKSHGKAKQEQKVHYVQMREEDSGSDHSDYTLSANSDSNRSAPLMATMRANLTDLEMEVDTGTALSLVSKTTYHKLWPTEATYIGECLEVKVIIQVKRQYQDQEADLELIVVAGSGPILMGRDWLKVFCLDWSQLHRVSSDTGELQNILDKHSAMFKDELGLVKGTLARIHINPSTKSCFHQPWSIPYALREKVERELERLEEAGIISAIQFSEWATPIIPVIKQWIRENLQRLQSNKLRLSETYPLPKVEDLL